MKTKLILTLASMLLLVPGLRAATPYAVYCEGDQSFHFLTADTEPSGSLSGQTITHVWKVNLTQGTSVPEWYAADISLGNITKVIFEESFKEVEPTSCTSWFNNFSGLSVIENLKNLNTSKVTYMYGMFNDCNSLTTLDLSSFNTSNVTDMQFMFGGCVKLTSLILSSFDTKNVTDMTGMFIQCTQLTSLDISNFVTSNVKSMQSMFSSCSNLRIVDLSNAAGKNEDLISQITENALVYVPAGTEVAEGRANVVVGETCANFVINYGNTENNQNLLNIPYGFTAEKVTINRQFTKDVPYSLYLPFALNATDFGKFFTYVGCSETSVQFEPVTEMTTLANTPYMLLPAANYAGGIVIEGTVTVKTTPENVGTDTNGYIGVYEKKTFTDEEVNSGLYYGWAGTDFCRAGAGASIDACRAYLKLPSNATFKAPARIAAKFGNNDFSGISDINSNDTTTDSPSYNLKGQRVNNGYRGIIIKDGKKIINSTL